MFGSKQEKKRSRSDDTISLSKLQHILTLIYFMHNSLRHHLASHNRQQSRFLKTVNRLPSQDQAPLIRQRTSNPVIRITSDCHQHSDLRWLEKVVDDMKKYKIEPENFERKNSVNLSLQSKRKDLQNITNLNTTVSHQKPKKQNVIQIQPESKSVKKIKFQVYSNKENKVSLVTRTSSKGKSKYKKMSEPVVRSQNKVVPTRNESKYQADIQKRSNSKQVIIEPCLTDTFIKEEIGDLWGDSLKRRSSREVKSTQSKKSAGKIRKNTITEGQQNNFISVVLDSKSLDEPQSQKKFIQKVYIKLQTENLSKYLNESSHIHDSKIDQEIQTQIYHKCCPTKRGMIDQNIMTDQVLLQNNDIKRTERIQKSSNTQHRRQTTPLKFNYSLNNGKEEEKNRNDEVKRGRSEQRKLNSKKEGTKDRENNRKDFSDQNSIQQLKKREQSKANASEIFVLKNLEKQQIKKIEIKQTKLFTLHSEQENNFQAQQHQIPCSESFNIVKVPFEGKNEKIQNPLIKPLQIEFLTCSPIQDDKRQNQQEVKKIPSLQVQPRDQVYEKQLTLLFAFLDVGKRNLLTSSNCGVEGLTEQLKLLFSSIIHQIKTKKRAFNLKKFIKESTAVLQIKKEVYNSTSRQPRQNVISQILKENIDLLKKQPPQQPTKETQPRLDFSVFSKRNSLNKRQVSLIDSLMKQEFQGDKLVTQKRYNFKEKIENNNIDMEEPEMFFKKKYGIVSNDKRNSLDAIQIPSDPRNSDFLDYDGSSW